MTFVQQFHSTLSWAWLHFTSHRW